MKIPAYLFVKSVEAKKHKQAGLNFMFTYSLNGITAFKHNKNNLKPLNNLKWTHRK